MTSLVSIVKFLKNGFSVRTSIRSTGREAEIRNAVDDELEKNLEFCQLDLNDDKGWDEAVKGCDRVIHMASPVVFKNLPDENSIIDPAKNGLLRALKPAVKYKVKRFVMTSSVAAVYSDSKNQKKEKSYNNLKLFSNVLIASFGRYIYTFRYQFYHFF